MKFWPLVVVMSVLYLVIFLKNHIELYLDTKVQRIFTEEYYEDNYRILMFRPISKTFFDEYKGHFVKEELIYQKSNGKDYFKEEYKEEVVYSKGSFVESISFKF